MPAAPVSYHDESTLGLLLAGASADVEQYDGKQLSVRVLANIWRANVIDHYCTLFDYAV